MLFSPPIVIQEQGSANSANVNSRHNRVAFENILANATQMRSPHGRSDGRISEMARNISRRRSLGLLGGVTGVVAGRATFLRAQSQPVRAFGGTIPFSGRWAEVGQSVNAGYQTVAKYVNDVNGERTPR